MLGAINSRLMHKHITLLISLPSLPYYSSSCKPYVGQSEDINLPLFSPSCSHYLSNPLASLSSLPLSFLLYCLFPHAFAVYCTVQCSILLPTPLICRYTAEAQPAMIYPYFTDPNLNPLFVTARKSYASGSAHQITAYR